MKILVTGGAGFIGSHLIDSLLEEGNEVFAIDNLSNGKIENITHNLENQNFEFIEMDLLDKEELFEVFDKNKFDAVFHFAANSDIQKGAEDRRVDLNNTFLTTFNVLECMAKADVREIIFPSTSAIYGQAQGEISEITPINPISFYGAAKQSSESYISSFIFNFNLNGLIVRFPNVVGERCTHGVIYDFIKKLNKNKDELKILGNGKQNKPYMYVKDLIKGILFCWKNYKKPLDSFNIAPDELVNVDKIAEIIISEMNLTPKITYTGGEGGWKGDVPYYKYNTEKLKNLGFNLENNSSEEAVKTAVKNILNAK